MGTRFLSCRHRRQTGYIHPWPHASNPATHRRHIISLSIVYIIRWSSIKLKKNCTCVCHYANVASHSFWTCCVQYFGIPSPLGQTTTTTTNTITSHVTSHKAVAHLTATKRIPPNSRFSIVLRRTPHSLLMPCLFVGKSTYVRSTNLQPYFTFSAAVINAGGMLSWNSSTFFLIVIHKLSSEKEKKRLIIENEKDCSKERTPMYSSTKWIKVTCDGWTLAADVCSSNERRRTCVRRTCAPVEA